MVNMTPEEAYLECINKNRRILELESIIATNSYFSYRYSYSIIKGRFIEGEKIIATDYYWSYLYAKDIIMGRFIEGEKIITTNPHYSYWYAKNIINRAFPLCHPIIFNSEWKNKYIDFLKKINYDLSKIVEWLI